MSLRFIAAYSRLQGHILNLIQTEKAPNLASAGYLAELLSAYVEETEVQPVVGPYTITSDSVPLPAPMDGPFK